MAISTFKLIQNSKVGGVLKIQVNWYMMGTEIFKIETEMTEKIKPQVATPTPTKMGRILNSGIMSRLRACAAPPPAPQVGCPRVRCKSSKSGDQIIQIFP